MTLLSVDRIDVHHGLLHAVRDFSLDIGAGETVAVIGANGAGKSTLLAALAGLMRPTSGTVSMTGTDITRMPAHRRVAAGISLVPEGRRLFRSLSVEENLRTGTYRGRKGPWSVGRVMDTFGWMKDRRAQNAAFLSGGEQQAVAIGRALVSNPDLLLIDELSLGLAPVVTAQMYEILPSISAEGTAVLIVEQDVTQALAASDRFLCLLEGNTVLSGSSADVELEAIEQAYFGLGERGHG